MFKDISIIGRVAYALYSLESYLLEMGEEWDKWEPIFDELWSFSEMEYVDEYCYKLVEYIPSCALEFDYYKADDIEYMTEEEFKYVYQLYKSCECIEDIEYVLKTVNGMIGSHLYTVNKAPATASLDVMNERIYPFFKEKLKKSIDVEPFKIYDVNDERCWGKMHSKQVLLENIAEFEGRKAHE